MEDTGKTVLGVKVYTDPNVPPATIYMLHDDFKNVNPKFNGKIEGLYSPPRHYGFWKRLKWHLWDSI